MKQSMLGDEVAKVEGVSTGYLKAWLLLSSRSIQILLSNFSPHPGADWLIFWAARV